MDDLLAAFNGISMDDKETVAKTFARVLHVSEQDSVFYLESCGGNLEMALNMFLNQSQSGDVVLSSEDLQSSSPPVAVFEGDITGVGNTLGQRQFAPGDEVVMVWRFRNSGAEAWPRVELCCADGDPFSFAGADLSNLAPGVHMDVAVSLRAPHVTGSVGGAFRLRSELHGYITEP